MAKQGKKDSTSVKLLPRDLSESLGKLPPQALDLEESVLGAVMLERGALLEIVDFLKPEHFYKDAHREIYEACVDLFRASNPVDMRSVYAKLRKNGKAELIGGAKMLADLTDKVNSSANIEYHSRIIIEMALKRELITLASGIHNDAYADETDVFELMGFIDMEMEQLAQGNLVATGEKHVKEYAVQSINNLQGRMQGQASGVISEFDEIDKITHGWQNSDLIIMAARPGMAKALGLNEKLLTPNGWIRMGDVKEGDKVAGSDGNFHNVTGVYPQGMRDGYKVVFDDRTEVVCDIDHLWFTETRADRKGKNRKHKGSVKTTKQIMESLTSCDGRKNHSIPYHAPIEFEAKPLPIHPYLYGLFLGDGCFTDRRFRFSNPEVDILEKIDNLLPEGYYLLRGKDDLNHSIKWIQNSNHKGMFQLVPELEGKHSYERSIPGCYEFNSVENRLHLLRGLLDTDGCVVTGNPTWIAYSTTSIVLRDQVIELVRSLGGRATFEESMGRYKVNGAHIETRTSYRIFIGFANGIVPVSSKKHLARFKQKQFGKKFIVDVIRQDAEPMQCISVDSPDRLYVTTGNTLTHNTAAVAQMLFNIARRGEPVGFFSIEMPGIQVVDRLAIGLSEVDPDKIRTGELTPIEFKRFTDAQGEISRIPMYIDDTGGINILELRAKARRMWKKHKIKILGVDYIQLVHGMANLRQMAGMTRDQEIGVITRTLKAIAKELNIPVIAISALSRGVETRGGDKRPQLSDLRESGNIESDADIVVFLYRPEYYHITTDEDGFSTHGKTEFIFAKHRNGSLGTAVQKFIGKYTKFTSWNHGAGGDYVPLASVSKPGFDASGYKNVLPNEDRGPEPTDDTPF